MIPTQCLLLWQTGDRGTRGDNHQRTSTQPRPIANQSDWFTVNRTEPFPNQSEPFRVELEKHIGMSSGIKRLQAVEVLLALDYEEARRSKDMKLAKACREEWLAIFEQLRRAEATNPEVEKSNKESVSVAEVEVEFSKLCGAIRAEVDALPARLTHKLVGLDSTAILAAIQREMAVFCRHFVEWRDLERGQS